jgi:hypothetical protein|tara:strand:+ start:952 stop:1308 length:357 start_codon:yes stop_codon:yes gene_type:complete
MLGKDNRLVKRLTQYRIWVILASALPLISLALLLLTDYLGWNEFYTKLSIILTCVFFSITILWWWWTMASIRDVLTSIQTTLDKFTEISTEVKSIKEDLNGLSSNRKRRKPKEHKPKE